MPAPPLPAFRSADPVVAVSVDCPADDRVDVVDSPNYKVQTWRIDDRHCKHPPNAIVLLYRDEGMFGMLVRANGGRRIDPA